MFGSLKWFLVVLAFFATLEIVACGILTKRSITDGSVDSYLTERTCWWNEVCKEEFQSLFRCRCPSWSFCRSPGRYYNAHCSMTSTGYIWTQPKPIPPVANGGGAGGKSVDSGTGTTAAVTTAPRPKSS